MPFAKGEVSEATGSQTRGPIVLMDEIHRPRLGATAKAFIEFFLRESQGPVVAKCYLSSRPPALHSDYRFILYNFEEAEYETKISQLAMDLLEKYNPGWVMSYGIDNEHLIFAFERLNIPVVVFIDDLGNSADVDDLLYNIALSTSDVVFLDSESLGSLKDGHWALDARDYKFVFGSGARRERGNAVGRTSLKRLWGHHSTRSVQIEEMETSAAFLRKLGTDLSNVIVGSDRLNIDRDVILKSGAFDKNLFLSSSASNTTEHDAVDMYLHASRLLIPRDRRFAGRLLRRPVAGFNPLIYASDNPQFDEASYEDPLAHYLRNGAPSGRWAHPIIRPTTEPKAEFRGRAALHAHFHYPDLLEELIDRLGGHPRIDLLVTTTSLERKNEIQAILDRKGVSPKLLVSGSNRGRDIGPFIDLLQNGILDQYDVVGHVHGKKSPHYDKGSIWRDFLWDDLIGHDSEMVDVILASFAADRMLGLVFAEDPHLDGWEENMDVAVQLAARMGLSTPLPNHFDYPMGSMFWVRPDAVKSLLTLNLREDDYPVEPIAIDGTILHALERLIAFCVSDAGYTYSTTYSGTSMR